MKLTFLIVLTDPNASSFAGINWKGESIAESVNYKQKLKATLSIQFLTKFVKSNFVEISHR
jgi:hypothetical protein